MSILHLILLTVSFFLFIIILSKREGRNKSDSSETTQAAHALGFTPAPSGLAKNLHSVVNRFWWEVNNTREIENVLVKTDGDTQIIFMAYQTAAMNSVKWKSFLLFTNPTWNLPTFTLIKHGHDKRSLLPHSVALEAESPWKQLYRYHIESRKQTNLHQNTALVTALASPQDTPPQFIDIASMPQSLIFSYGDRQVLPTDMADFYHQCLQIKDLIQGIK